MSFETVNCMICFEKFSLNDQLLSTLCGHVFHQQCMEDWRTMNNCCPSCRSIEPLTHKIYVIFSDVSALKKENEQLRLQIKTANRNLNAIQNELEEYVIKHGTVKNQLKTIVKSREDMKLKADEKIKMLENQLKNTATQKKIIKANCEDKITVLRKQLDIANKNQFDSETDNNKINNESDVESNKTVILETNSNRNYNELKNELKLRVDKCAELEKKIIELSSKNIVMSKQLDEKSNELKMKMITNQNLEEKMFIMEAMIKYITAELKKSKQLSVENGNQKDVVKQSTLNENAAAINLPELVNSNQNEHLNATVQVPNEPQKEEELHSGSKLSYLQIDVANADTETDIIIESIEVPKHQGINLCALMLDLATAMQINLTTADIQFIKVIRSYQINDNLLLVLRVKFCTVALKEEFLKGKVIVPQIEKIFDNIRISEFISTNIFAIKKASVANIRDVGRREPLRFTQEISQTMKQVTTPTRYDTSLRSLRALHKSKYLSPIREEIENPADSHTSITSREPQSTAQAAPEAILTSSTTHEPQLTSSIEQASSPQRKHN